MRKQVSTQFAVIVIVFALAVAALYFMHQYRTYEQQQKDMATMMQRQADQAKRSRQGMAGGAMPGGMRRGMRGATGAKAPGAMPGGPMGAKAPAGKPAPEKAAPTKPAQTAPAPAKAAPAPVKK